MKTLLIISLAIFGNLLPQVDQAPIALDDVCRAIGSGNVAELSAVMDEEVQLTILDKEDFYSKAQAATVLKSFFSTNTPSSFGKVHQGASKAADAEYCIGTLATAKGPFRVYVYVAKKSTGVLLQEIRFERE